MKYLEICTSYEKLSEPQLPLDLPAAIALRWRVSHIGFLEKRMWLMALVQKYPMIIPVVWCYVPMEDDHPHEISASRIQSHTITGWWFQTCFPYILGIMFSHIFLRGWLKPPTRSWTNFGVFKTAYLFIFPGQDDAELVVLSMDGRTATSLSVWAISCLEEWIFLGTWWRTTHGELKWVSSPQFFEWINPTKIPVVTGVNYPLTSRG